MSWKDESEVVDVDWKAQSEVVHPKIIQEMHPRFSSKNRAIAKNFAQSTEKQVEFLKKQYPEMDIKVFDGEVVGRLPSERDFKVLDPNTGFFSRDFLNDAADVAFDTGAGVVEGVATGLGAAGGAIATPFAGGAGAIPGAMLAGGATSAAGEGLRQTIGRSLGIPQEIDMNDVAISGAIGAATPALFGAGSARGAIKTGLDGFAQMLRQSLVQ